MAVLLLAPAGCREIPPEIPADYIGSQAAPGWPPLAVHDPDPFHPRNRWFHRAFGARAASGAIVAPHADDPIPLHAALSRVDAAEAAALLERSLADAAPDVSPGRARVAEAIFRSDALAEAALLHAALPADHLAVREAVPRLLDLAAGDPLPPLDPETARAVEPPPLRAGEWVEVAPPAEPGLLPSPFDPRWTHAFVPGGEKRGRWRAVIVRHRAALDRAGAPLLLPVASECWSLEDGDEDAGGSAWRFDRAEWLAGREPWRRLPGEAEITIRDPGDPSRLLTARAASLAARCRRGLRADAPASGGEAAQLEAVARALEGLLASRRAGP
jgi:hypothetical protein